MKTIRDIITKSFLLGALLATTNTWTVIHAQESSAALEEIIVTAQKREQSAQDVPISITAMDEELLSSTIRNISDVTGYAPNVVLGGEGRRGGATAIQIRGIAAATNTDNTFDSPIAVNVDGVYLGQNAGSLLDNFDMVQNYCEKIKTSRDLTLKDLKSMGLNVRGKHGNYILVTFKSLFIV